MFCCNWWWVFFENVLVMNEVWVLVVMFRIVCWCLFDVWLVLILCYYGVDEFVI